MKSQAVQRVVMLGFDDAQILDITAPLEVFARCARWLVDHRIVETRPYTVELVAETPGPVRCSSGLTLTASRAFAEVDDADIILVTGGIGYRSAIENPALLSWLRTQSKRVSRIGSICNGSLILAAAGLLDHRPAATHWAYQEMLAATWPTVRVAPNVPFVRAGNVYTSAGVLCGMELALGIVEEDWGSHVAKSVARELMMFKSRD